MNGFTVSSLSLLLIVSVAAAGDVLSSSSSSSSHHSDENNDGLDDRYDLNRDGKPDDGATHHGDHSLNHHHHNDKSYELQVQGRGYGHGLHSHSGHVINHGLEYNRYPEQAVSYPSHGYHGKEHGYGYHDLREPVHYGGNHGLELKESLAVGAGYNFAGETYAGAPYSRHGYGLKESVLGAGYNYAGEAYAAPYGHHGYRSRDHGLHGMGYGHRAGLGYRSGYEYGVNQGYGLPYNHHNHYHSGLHDYEPYRFL